MQSVTPHFTSAAFCCPTFLHQKIILGKMNHTHTQYLLSAHSLVKDLYKDEEFPHFIIYNKLFIWVLKCRHLKSSLIPLLPTMVTYLCKRIHNTDFMLIFLNLYFLHFNLTALTGNSFQAPLQIFIGCTVDGEIILNRNTSILTTPQPDCPGNVGSHDNKGNFAPRSHREVSAR